MRENDLTSLPPEIGQLNNLTSLICMAIDGGNRAVEQLDQAGFAGSDLTSLPPEIGHLGSLTELDFITMNLKSLPPEIAVVQLNRAGFGGQPTE